MLRLGALAAVSALALAACGDIVKIPGANNTGGDNTSETADPAPETPATDTTSDPVAQPAPEPEQPDPAIVTTDPEPATDTTEPAVTDPETPTDVTEPTDISSEPGDGEVIPEPIDLGIGSLLEVNAQICAASDTETMTIAEVAGAGDPESTFSTAVVNGAQVDRADFPGIVKLEPRRRIPGTTRTSSGHCAATRISDQWFVTAAHCLDTEYDSVNLVAGVNRLNDPTAKRVAAQTTICHSSYGGSAEEYANDIALIKLAPDASAVLDNVPVANFGETQKLLGATNYPTVDMAGWGLTGFSGNLSNELLTAQLKTNNVGPAIISIASQNGAGPCVGDSGGPLFVTEADGSKTLVGVLSVVENNLSTGKFCEGDYNGRYTNLQGFQTWIDAVIEVCDSVGGETLCIDG